MAKMNLKQYMESLQGGDLRLVAFEKNANGRLTKATDESGDEHVMSSNNLKRAMENDTAVDDDGVLVIPEDRHSVADNGLTLISYGGGIDISKEKFE